MSPTPIGGPGGGGTAGTPLRNMLYMALRLAGVTLGPGRTPSVDQLGDAFLLLNLMIGFWAQRRRAPFYTRIDQVPLTTSKTYTVGTGADWDIPRPIEVIRAVLVNNGETPVVRYGPVDLLDDAAFAQIGIQDYSEGIPWKLYYNRSFDSETGFGTAYLIGQTTATYALELYTKSVLTQFASLDDNVFLPDGYEAAITDNLAVMIGSIPAWGGTVQQETKDRARLELSTIESRNAPRPPALNGDAAALNDSYGWSSLRSIT